jgi:hypothetical protein
MEELCVESLRLVFETKVLLGVLAFEGNYAEWMYEYLPKGI